MARTIRWTRTKRRKTAVTVTRIPKAESDKKQRRLPLAPAPPDKTTGDSDEDFWKNKVNLAGHCAICLLDFKSTSTSSRPRRAASISTAQIPDLATIWNCLPRPVKKDDDCNILKLRRQKLPTLLEGLIFLNGNNELLQSPRLCVKCDETVTTLANLREKLMKIKGKIEAHEKRLRKTMKLSRSKERQLELSRSLLGNGDLPEMCYQNTVKFLGTLHRGGFKDLIVKVEPGSSFINQETKLDNSSSNHFDCNNETEDDHNDLLEMDWDANDDDDDAEDFVQVKIEPNEENYFSNDDYEDEQVPSGSESKSEVKSITCEVCREKIPAPQLFTHMQSHTGDFATKCPNPNCDYAFVSEVCVVVRHLRRDGRCRDFFNYFECDSNNQRTCQEDNCDFQVSDRRTFRKHLQRHETLQKNFTCPLLNCGEQFTIRKSVEYHLMDKHAYSKYGRVRVEPEPDPPGCQKCDQCSEQISLDKIQNHLRTTHQIEPQAIVSCKSCPCKFSNRLNQIDHVVTWHKVEGFGFTCDICNTGQRFFFGSKLREHYYKHHGVGTQIQCEHEKCTFAAFSQNSMQYHVKMKHPAPGVPVTPKYTKKFQCESCEKKFASFDYLTYHLITQHGAPKLKCRYCDKEFNSDARLNLHVKVEHLGLDFGKAKFPCSECEKCFATRNGYKEHVKAVHRKITLKCDQCDKRFAKKVSLLNHMGVAHEVGMKKVHMCDECGRSFHLKALLTAHKRIHTGERPFVCQLCGSSFRQNGTLINHMRSHKKQGEKFKPTKTFERGLNGRKIAEK